MDTAELPTPAFEQGIETCFTEPFVERHDVRRGAKSAPKARMASTLSRRPMRAQVSTSTNEVAISVARCWRRSTTARVARA
jgi:hypothetical protein